MTQAFSEIPQGDAENFATVQCHLCLRDIQYSRSNEEIKEKGYVSCNHCDYKQPVTKFPRPKDIAIFGVTVSAVYIATIVAVLIAR